MYFRIILGCSHRFGYKAVKDFLDKNDLVCIVRAHEVQEEGFKRHFDPVQMERRMKEILGHNKRAKEREKEKEKEKEREGRVSRVTEIEGNLSLKAPSGGVGDDSGSKDKNLESDGPGSVPRSDGGVMMSEVTCDTEYSLELGTELESESEPFSFHTEDFPPVITIFSAPNYCDRYQNKAAILRIDLALDEFRVIQYSCVAHPVPEVAESQMDNHFLAIINTCPYMPTSLSNFVRLAVELGPVGDWGLECKEGDEDQYDDGGENEGEYTPVVGALNQFQGQGQAQIDGNFEDEQEGMIENNTTGKILDVEGINQGSQNQNQGLNLSQNHPNNALRVATTFDSGPSNSVKKVHTYVTGSLEIPGKGFFDFNKDSLDGLELCNENGVERRAGDRGSMRLEGSGGLFGVGYVGGEREEVEGERERESDIEGVQIDGLRAAQAGRAFQPIHTYTSKDTNKDSSKDKNDSNKDINTINFKDSLKDSKEKSKEEKEADILRHLASWTSPDRLPTYPKKRESVVISLVRSSVNSGECSESSPNPFNSPHSPIAIHKVQAIKFAFSFF